MAPPKIEQNPFEFLIVRYTPSNESFPSELDCCVNGHAGRVVADQNRVIPRFLFEALKNSYNYTHRERSQSENNDNYVSSRVHPNLDAVVVPEEYQNAEGIMKLIQEAKTEKDPNSWYYRLQLGVKNLIYGSMQSAEAEAEKMDFSPAVQDNSDERAELLYLKKENETLKGQLGDLSSKMEMVLAKVGGDSVEDSKDDESKEDLAERTYKGKVYATPAAAKSAKTRDEKKVAEAESKGEGSSEEDDDSPIEVDS